MLKAQLQVLLANLTGKSENVFHAQLSQTLREGDGGFGGHKYIIKTIKAFVFVLNGLKICSSEEPVLAFGSYNSWIRLTLCSSHILIKRTWLNVFDKEDISGISQPKSPKEPVLTQLVPRTAGCFGWLCGSVRRCKQQLNHASSVTSRFTPTWLHHPFCQTFPIGKFPKHNFTLPWSNLCR